MCETLPVAGKNSSAASGTPAPKDRCSTSPRPNIPQSSKLLLEKVSHSVADHGIVWRMTTQLNREFFGELRWQGQDLVLDRFRCILEGTVDHHHGSVHCFHHHCWKSLHHIAVPPVDAASCIIILGTARWRHSFRPP